MNKFEKFDKCFEKVVCKEGGYSNDPDDKGGETYMGISRKNNPSWTGWKRIDIIKSKYPINSINGLIKYSNESNFKELRSEARNLYKTKYWDVMYLDEVPNFKVCYQLFDSAVNMGVPTAIRIAQQLCGMTITGNFGDELLYNLRKL